MASGGKRIAGVIGWPVKHSLSPKLHNYWLKKYGIDGEYKALAVEPKDLELAIKKIIKEGWRGCNFTLPHKEKAVDVLRELGGTVDNTVEEMDALNTLVVNDGKLRGMNTDIYGFKENIKGHLGGKSKVVVLGAGGAAKAVCYALLELGFGKIVATNRTHEKAVALSSIFKQKIITGRWDERTESLKDTDLLVNATSLGMVGKEPLEIDLSLLPTSALVTDIVYTPLMTPLLLAAKARGNPVIDGLGMLLHQAVPGFEAWFGKKPEVTDDLKTMLLT